MSETYTKKHLDLLNLIATSPPPIDSSQMVTKLRRPSLEDIFLSPTTAAKASNRLSGIYVRSRPTSFSELEVAFDPDYDYEELLACPISPTAVKDTLASLGLKLQQGHSFFRQLSQYQGQFQEGGLGTPSRATVDKPNTARPPKPTRPLPNPEGPPAGYVTVMTSEDEYESEGEEIVYMLDDYNSRHQCMVGDAKDFYLAPDLIFPLPPKGPTVLTEEQQLAQGFEYLERPTITETNNACRSEVDNDEPQNTETPVDGASRTSEDSQGSDGVTSRAKKRMGLVGPQSITNEIAAPTVNAPPKSAETNARPAARARTSSKTVTFAPDTVIRRERKTSMSKARIPKAGEDRALVSTTSRQPSPDKETKSSATDGEDQTATPAVEVFEVDFAELENANAMPTVDGTSCQKTKRKHHFGVYKIIRNVLKRNSGGSKVEKPAAAVVEESARSKTPTPSITTTKRTVLCKPDPAAKARKSSAASVYSVGVVADTGSQKTKKSARAWSIRSGKGRRKGAADPVQNPATESATGTGLLAPPATRRVGILRRSASFAGFATMTTPEWNDPVDMEQLLQDAAQRLQQNPQVEWAYKPRADPILEEGENPIHVGFVFERHVAV